MKKVIEWFLGLFFSKEAIDLVRREAAYEAKIEFNKYKNKEYLSNFTSKGRYKKVPTK